MNILVSGFPIKAGITGGIEHMFYNLMNGFGSTQATIDLIFGRTEDLSPDFLDSIASYPNMKACPTGWSGNRFLGEQFSLFSERPRNHYEAVLFTNYFTPAYVPQKAGKCVTVIHDLLYNHFPSLFPPQKRAWLFAAHLVTLLRADAVVAISVFVRDDILRVYGKAFEKKLHVIHNPISWERFQVSGETKLGPLFDGRPFLLSVAAHFPNKNLDTLIKAFARLSVRYPDLILALVGQLQDNLSGSFERVNTIQRGIAELGLENRVRILGYLNDEQLGHYLRNCQLFVFPSVFEGFGMPPVEALGLGVPTLTTQCASLAEVTLGGAFYVDDPYNVGEWSERIDAILAHPDDYTVPQSLSQKIRQHYAPERIAQQYFDLLAGHSPLACPP